MLFLDLSTKTACLAPIAAVVAAITAIIMVIKNWDAIVEAAQMLWEEFCEMMSGRSDIFYGTNLEVLG